LATIGEGDSAKSDAVVKMARHAADRFGPHVKTFIVARNAAASGSAEDLLIDATGTAHSRLGGGEEPSLCVVRPDGHLGLRLTPPWLVAFSLRKPLLGRVGFPWISLDSLVRIETFQ